jgi:PAS domain S-box-containing protein
MISSQSFLKIFQSLPSSSVILLPDAPSFTIKAISAGYLNRLDNNRALPIGESLFSLYSFEGENNDAIDSLSDSLKLVCDSGKTDKSVPRKNTTNGRYFQFENIPVLDSFGEIEYIIHHLLEVTPNHNDNPIPRKNAEELPLTEQRYKALVEDGSDLVGILDDKGNYIYVSPSYSTILGFSREELIGKNAFDFIYPDDKNDVFDFFSKILNEKKLNIPPYRFVQKDGSFRWIETVLTNMLENNAVGGIVANCKDVTASRKTAEALKLSEEKYKLLFQYSPIPNWIYDIETLEILDVNETAIAHYGYSRKEFLKLGLRGLRPPEEVPKVVKAIAGVKNKKGFLHFGIFTHLKKNHEIIKADVSGHKFSFMGRGAMMVVCLDITEKENALQELRDNQEKLLLVQKIAKLGYWKLQLDSQTLFWSDSVYKIWGVEKENFKVNFESFFNSIHPDDQEEFVKAQSAAIADEYPLNFVHRIISGDGSIKWVHEKGKLIKNDHGTPVIFEGSIQDITVEKQLELSLEESNQRYKYVSKATSDAIWDWNLETDTIYWGEGFELIFGHTIKSLKHDTSSWKDHIHPDDYRRIINDIREAVKSSRLNWSNEYRFLKADKTYAYVIDKGFFIRDKDGKALRMVGAMQDITERKIQSPCPHRKLGN